MTLDPDAWGIDRGYHDANGEWREPGEDTIRALLAAMGAQEGARATPPAVDDLWVVHAGDTVQVGGHADLHTEDGRVVPIDGAATNLPLGYHWLDIEGDRRVRLVVSPGRCPNPPQRAWGWAVQLYAARSATSWGIGDLHDLATLARWAGGQGARLILLSPLHAPTPVRPVQTSPYYPASRCFRSPLHLSVDALLDRPSVRRSLDAASSDAVSKVARIARALNSERSIDRDEVLRLKMEALHTIWEAVCGTDDVEEEIDAHVGERGALVEAWGRFCALAEVHGASWREWPAELHDRTSARVQAAADPSRTRFHVWLQLLIEEQLAAASHIDLMQDLAVGVDPAGADTWLWPDAFAEGVSVGAPPDEYNTKGQDWGLPPFDPWALRRLHFEPFIETVRAGFRHAGGLRVDHVMGLFRLFWIPEGEGAQSGTYVRYPWEEMLAILALEAHRAGAYVVGEDLGTVEPWVRDALAERGVLSYRLAWFEPDRPASFPERSLGAITTHDLPTVAGLWSGSDVDAQRAREMVPNLESTGQLLRRLRAWTGLEASAATDEVVLEAHRLLAAAPSSILTASLDDALGVEERPNYPGTVGGTNWSLALPVPIEQAMVDPRVEAVARVLNSR